MGTVRRAAHVFLAVLLALPVAELRSAPATGTIEGVVRLEGRPLSGVTVAFIELESGSVVRATSKADGAFSIAAPTGEYTVTTESRAGLAVGHAPVKVAVSDGRIASADVDLVAVASAVAQDPAAAPPPAQEPAPPTGETPATMDAQEPAVPVWADTSGTGAQIQFEPVTCFVAGEFPLLDTSIEPVASVARARVYFRGALGDDYYYIEMSEQAGKFFGKLPRPSLEASPITYYLQSTTTEFEESQTREIEALVVQDAAECGDRKVAAIGPAGAVTIFSAATGASIIAPAGFAAVAASGLAVGAITVIAAAAAAAGVVGGVVVAPPGGGGGGPTPPPIIINPSPIPTPTPLPLPTPTPLTTFR